MKITMPTPRGKSAMERAIRTLAMLLVFLVVIWAFYKNNENVMERIQKTRSVWDETGQMHKEELEFLRSFARTVRGTFGVTVRIQVFVGDIEKPDLDSKTMYIGISPALKQVVVEFPALMRPALGMEFIESLRTEYFEEAFDTGEWPRELQILTTVIWSRLTALEEGEQQ